MAGAAISGFVDGLFQGIGARHGWEDRKRNIGREKRMDEIRDNVDRRSEDEHNRRMGVYDRQASDWQRGREDEDFWRKTFEGAADAASMPPQAIGAAPQSAPVEQAPQQPVVSTSGDQGNPPTVAAPAAALGVDPRMLQTNYAAATMERLSPASELAAAAEAAVVTPRRAGSAGPQAAIDAAPNRANAPPAQSPMQEAPYQRGLRYLPDGTAIAPAPSAAIADEMGAARGGPQGVRYLPPQAERPAPPPEITQDMAARMVREGVAQDPNMPRDLRTMADGVNSLPSPSTRPVQTSPQRPGMPTTQAGRDSLAQLSTDFQAAATRAPDVAPPPSIPMKAAATPQDKQAAATAVTTLDANATPETKDATLAATQAMGVKPGQKTITEAQYTRGSEAWINRYMEVGAPQVLEAMISRGEFAKAEAFQQFMQNTETRAGMKDWSMAAAAATLGDIDKFGKHIISAYNRMGYFADGTELVEAESGFTKGKDGVMNGARLTFKDAATGQKFEQVFNGPDDLIKTGITLLAPENAFNIYWQQQQAAAENAKGAMTAADKQAEAAQKDQIEVLKIAKDIAESSLGQITMEQAIQQVLSARSSMSMNAAAQAGGGAGGNWGGGTSGPPVAYRPTN